MKGQIKDGHTIFRFKLVKPGEGMGTAKARDPKFSVMIKGDARAPYAGVVSVVDLVTRLEIQNVGLITARIGT